MGGGTNRLRLLAFAGYAVAGVTALAALALLVAGGISTPRASTVALVVVAVVATTTGWLARLRAEMNHALVTARQRSCARCGRDAFDGLVSYHRHVEECGAPVGAPVEAPAITVPTVSIPPAEPPLAAEASPVQA